MRIAIVGLGGIAGKAYLPLLAAREGLELLPCSRSAATAERIRTRYRLPDGATDLDAVLGWKPRAAFVLTPSPTHAAIVRTLLEAGVDVLVEKPATLRSEDTRALAELADAAGRVLMVGFNRRFAPLHRQARALWADRNVGTCVVEKHRSDAVHASLLENYVEDTIHAIDTLRFFCGEGEAVATHQRVRDGRLVGAVSLVRLQGGGQAVVATSLESGGWAERIGLHGDGVLLDLEAFSALRWRSGGDERSWREEYASGWRPTLEARGFAAMVDHFLECVETRRPPLTSGWEAYRTQRLLEDMVAAAS
jgi:virulence factor